MIYKIRDLQFSDRHFADGALFKNKKQVCEQLIDYHSADCDMTIEIQLLNAGRIDECWQALAAFDWELIEIKPEKRDKWVMAFSDKILNIVDHKDEFSRGDLQGALEALTGEIFERGEIKISNTAENYLDSQIAKIEKAYAQYTEPLICIGVFSNGEAVYQKAGEYQLATAPAT